MKLKEYRNLHNLTQADCGKIIGKTGTGYSYYESGKNEPDILSLVKLADYYHITVDALIDHNVPYLLDTSSLTAAQQSLLEDIKRLSPENCKRVQDFITGIMVAEEEKQKIINLYKTKGD